MNDALSHVAAKHGVTVPELVSRLREVADAYAANPTTCDMCEGPLPQSVVTRRGRYCGSRCRKAAQRERQRAGGHT